MLLSIVIVNYNNLELLKRCIFSVLNNITFTDYEIIVVDNASTDKSDIIIGEKFPSVTVIKNRKNMGFAYANNQGIRKSSGRFIFLLNSDTELTTASIEVPMTFLINNQSVGIVACSLYNPDGTQQNTARAFPTPINAFWGRRSILTKLFPKTKFVNQYFISLPAGNKKPYEVDWISGAFFMFKKEVVDTIGLLDEKYFFYWEDVDYCFRAKAQGWKVYCTPDAFIYHYEGSTRGKVNLLFKNVLSYHFYRGAYRFYTKHYAGCYNPMRYIAFLGLLLKYLFEVILNTFKCVYGNK